MSTKDRLTMTKAHRIVKIIDTFMKARGPSGRRKVLASYVKHFGLGDPFIHAFRCFDEFDIGLYLIDSEYAGKFILVGSDVDPVEGATNVMLEDLVCFSRYAYATLQEQGYDLEAENLRVIKEWKNKRSGA